MEEQWKVYFDAGFWGHHGRDHAGKEIPVGKQLEWAGHHWVIPGVYSCGRGLVVDLCMRVSARSIRSFMEKWKPGQEAGWYENLSREQQMQMELEHPLCMHIRPRIEVNGKMLQASRGCSVSFHPCLPDQAGREPEVKRIMDYYGLDDSFGWIIYRNAFRWAGRCRPEIRTLFLTLEQQPVQIPGPHVRLHGVGDRFTFSSPASGLYHTLTVKEIEHQSLPSDRLADARLVCPTHYIAMSYTLSPEPAEKISLFDCAESDRPRAIGQRGGELHPAASGVSIIGGADGPTEIVLGTDFWEPIHIAYSALHFEPVSEEVEWRMVFSVRQFEEASFVLL